MRKTGNLKKILGLFIILLFSVLFINSVIAQIRINEIELNPSGADTGNEWIELYSDSLININGWRLVNHDNKTKTLTQTFQGYLVINFSEQWLDNENESINLYDSNWSLISFSPILKDIFDNSKSWSYCDSSWKLVDASPGSANNCINNISQNNTQNVTATIALQLNWDEDDIKNGKQFEIQVKALNLENKDYDIQVYIYDNDEAKTLTEIRDGDNWESAKTRLKKFFTGSGNRTGYVKLRIKDSKRDFSGTASIVAIIKEYSASSEKARIDKSIDVIKADSSDLIKTTTESSQSSNDREKVIKQIQNSQTNSQTTGDVIRLGKSSSSSKTTVYESTNEKIKKYSIYAFALLIVLLIILFIFRKQQ